LAPFVLPLPRDGMEVRATGERSLASQRMVLELLLSDMPAEA